MPLAAPSTNFPSASTSAGTTPKSGFVAEPEQLVAVLLLLAAPLGGEPGADHAALPVDGQGGAHRDLALAREAGAVGLLVVPGDLEDQLPDGLRIAALGPVVELGRVQPGADAERHALGDAQELALAGVVPRKQCHRHRQQQGGDRQHGAESPANAR